MARINIEEKWWSDPRRLDLTLALGKATADGVFLIALRCAQEANGKAFDPTGKLPNEWIQALVGCCLGLLGDDGLFYLKGAEQHFSWLEHRKEAGKVGGRTSARRKRNTKGQLLPKQNPSKTKQTQASSSSSFSSSISSSSSFATSDQKKPEEIVSATAAPPAKVSGVRTWEAYRDAYKARYGVEPVRNATVNAQCSQIAKRLGEADAPEVARFFVSHNDGYYLRRKHSIGQALADAEGLFTQWKQGRATTSNDVRQFEKQDRFRSQLERIEKGEL